jgi:chromosome segregation ATPase
VDVERTIEFILDSQAKTEVRLTGITKLLQQGMRMLVKTDTTLAQLAEAQKRTDARLAEFQKRTDAKFAELAEAQAELAEAQKELTQEMTELAKAQRETERTLRAFIKGQRNGQNSR